MEKHILVVDDEKKIVKGIRFSLEQESYKVDVAYDGEEAVEAIRLNKYDVVVLDVMLPKMDGIEVLRTVRDFTTVPVIMLTAKGEDMDKILGLEFGADDYMTKPFNILELKARIKAILRRNKYAATPVEVNDADTLIDGDIIVKLDSRRVFIENEEANLTAKEFDLLLLLMKNANKVYSREELLNIVWGYDFPGDVRTVDVHIRRLREKIEASPSEPQYIHTKWGVGYYYHQ